MKKTIITISMALTAMIGYSQGTVSTINSGTTLISTNNTSTSATGSLPAAAGQYYFALLTQSMATFGVADTAPTALQLAGWTFTGNYTTNIASAGRENGGANIPTGTGWGAGVTNSYVLVGWSANLGSSWATIENEIQTGWTANGYFGISSVGFGEAGGGPDSLPAFSLFGSVPTAAGTPISSGFDLNNVGPVPEPCTMALAALGGASLLMFRRKK
jgi:hypothetical protein